MARKRPIRETPLGPPVTVELMLGWCTTGHHEGCVKQTQYYEKTYACSCKCHTQKEKPNSHRKTKAEK